MPHFSFRPNAPAGPVPVERVVDHYGQRRAPPAPIGPVPMERMIGHYRRDGAGGGVETWSTKRGARRSGQPPLRHGAGGGVDVEHEAEWRAVVVNHRSAGTGPAVA